MTTKDRSRGMRPRARIISLLGNELISDEAVAIVELVKNAYDADASIVHVQFEGKAGLPPENLVIQDDGVGMSLRTLFRGWFEPGTLLKKKGTHSPAGRLYLGAKGIGRFAAARLAKELMLETKIRMARQGVNVLIDWGEFDRNSFLDEVTILYECSDTIDFPQGTVLRLNNIESRKKWAEDDFILLHDRLSRLISPFEEDKIGFVINLEIPGYPHLGGEVEPHELVGKPIYLLKGSLSETGVLNGELLINNKVKQRFRNRALGGKDEKVKCGAFQVEIRAWDRDRPGLTPFMLEFSKSLTGIRQILDAYCGVSIYRDGFRVHPYGEKGNDWLSLDTASRLNPTLRLSNNQLVAAIRISRETNSELKDRSTREGLIHNKEYDSLMDWFKRVLAILEEKRYEVRPRENAEVDERQTLYEPFDLTDVVKAADKQLGKKHPVSQLVHKKDVEIREGVKRLQSHYSRLLMIAGIGQLVDVVIHEIGSPIQRIKRELNYITKKHAKEFPKQAVTSLASISGWIEQLYSLRERLDPKRAGKRGRATSFSVQEEIQGNLDLYENLIGKQCISVNVRAPKTPLAVHMSRSALGQIVANLLDNSVYWLTRYHGDGNGGKISIHLTSLKDGFRIRFNDDGPGINEGNRERIFEPYFTTKSAGMGLGLYIARQIMEPYGKLLIKEDCALPGACFEASFTQRVGL